jgi:hypothetical protein
MGGDARPGNHGVGTSVQVVLASVQSLPHFALSDLKRSNKLPTVQPSSPSRPKINVSLYHDLSVDDPEIGKDPFV